MKVVVLLLCLTLCLGESFSELAFNSYNNAFYVERSNTDGFYVIDSRTRSLPDDQQFWKVCEQVEAVEDALENPTVSIESRAVYGNVLRRLINGLNHVVSKNSSPDFASWNDFNDDVVWAVIALTRAYKLTGDTNFLNQAKMQFDKVWIRGKDSDLGGGLWWRTDKQSKNACVNGPAVIAAMLLYKQVQHEEKEEYKQRALQLYDWLKNTLLDKSSGRISDHIEKDGRVVSWNFSYNQGTFIGAATLLYEETRDKRYLKDAALAASWARFNMTGLYQAGILNDDCDNSDRSNDCWGFKGILMRWIAKYVQASKDKDIARWIVENADTAWSNRNRNGVTWAQWWHRTPDDFVTSWECSSSLTLFQVKEQVNLEFS